MAAKKRLTVVTAKNDHGVLSVRIPREYVEKHGICKGDSIICQEDLAGRLIYRSMVETIEAKHESKRSKYKRH